MESRRVEWAALEVLDSVLARREERVPLRLVRWADWVLVASRLSAGRGIGVDEERAGEGERLGCGEVCVATSRWKSSVGGSESRVDVRERPSSSSFLSAWMGRFRPHFRSCALNATLCGMAGMWLTLPSSFSFSLSRLCSAVLARSWRAEASDWSIGWMRYLLVP